MSSFKGLFTSKPELDAIGKQEAAEELLGRLTADGSITKTQLTKGGEELDIACIQRWLASTSYHADKAEEMLVAHAKWRAESVSSGRTDELTVKNALADGKLFLQGWDRQQHPVILYLASKHFTATRDLDETKRLIVYTFDSCIDLMGPGSDGKFSGIFYLTGMGTANADVYALRAIFDLLQNHYPERLAYLIFYDAPLVFTTVWAAVKPFVSAKLKEKVIFVTKKAAEREFAKLMDPEVLPEILGGKAQLVPIQEAAALAKDGRLGGKD